MPTATNKSPAALLAGLRRLRRLSPPPQPTPADLARLRSLAADESEPVPDADSPEVGVNDPRIIQVNPLQISRRNAAWYAQHGGSDELNRALDAHRAALRSQQTSRSDSGSRRATSRRR